jgi:hypothetical protein
MELFKDIIPALQKTKVDLRADDGFAKTYAPFMVNRAMSNSVDCAMAANEMNQRHFLDKDVQFRYYLNTLRAWKRPWSPWSKKDTAPHLDAVKEYFGYSERKALAALQVLTDDQLANIVESVSKGGVVNGSGKADRGQAKKA